MKRAIGATVYLARTRGKSDSGKPKYPVPLKRDAENSAVSGHIILDDGDIVHCGIRSPSASDGRGALQCYRLRDPWTRSPAKRSRRKRDRITVMRGVLQSLQTRCRAVGRVNRSSAARSAKAAQNKDHKCCCRSKHYQNQLTQISQTSIFSAPTVGCKSMFLNGDLHALKRES